MTKPKRKAKPVFIVKGHPDSINTARVEIALHEKEIAYDFVREAPKNKDDGSKEPTIADLVAEPTLTSIPPSLELAGSAVIIRHLATAYPHKGNMLLPGIDELKPDLFEEIAVKLIWEYNFNYIVVDNYKGWRRPSSSRQLTEGGRRVIEAEELKLANLLQSYEEKLDQSMFLGGTTFTVVDLRYIPLLLKLRSTKTYQLFDRFPRFKAWADKIMKRKAVMF